MRTSDNSPRPAFGPPTQWRPIIRLCARAPSAPWHRDDRTDNNGSLAGVGASATPVLDNLSPALTTLTPAARILPAAGSETLAALIRLHAATPVANQLLDALRTVPPVLKSDLPPLTSVPQQLTPLVRYLAPCAPDFAHLFERWTQPA